MHDYKHFSVAMSVYKNDNSEYLDRALYSITENQTIMPDDIVVVVDGPIPEVINKVIEKYRVKYRIFNVIYLEQNVGLGNALRTALDNVKYELVARMDSDDVSVSNRFEQQLNFFNENPNIDIVGGDITEFIGEESCIVGRRSVPITNQEIYDYMKKRCAMNHVSVMFKKSSVKAVGGYKDWYCNEDYYLWIRMCMRGMVFANTGSILVNVRVGEDMYQRRGGAKYFESEKELQKYMLDQKMIGMGTFLDNVFKRWLVQKVFPNKIRGWIFRKFARGSV